MLFKKVIAAAAVSLSLLYGAPSSASVCGYGKIIEVREGGFDADNLLIHLKLAKGGEADDDVRNTLYRSLWIRFQSASLTKERMNGIRSLAYLALVSGKSAYVYTHNTDGCKDATELSLFNEGVDPKNNGVDENT